MDYDLLLTVGSCVLSLLISVAFAAGGVILGKAMANGPDFKDRNGFFLAFVFAIAVNVAVFGAILGWYQPEVIGIWCARVALFAAFLAIGLLVKDRSE